MASVSAENPYLGIGLYSIPDAARIIRTPSRTLYNWAQGYSFRRDSKRVSEIAPLIDRDYPELIDQKILTFLDLVELSMVRLFRGHGVSMRTIREASKRLAEKYGTNHPFAVAGVRTDGKRVFDKDFEELGRYQFVIDVAAQPFFKQLEYRDDIAFRLWPLGEGRVVIDPKRSFGKPLIHHGSVPTYSLYKMRVAGESSERISRWWGVSVKAVEDAIEYETSLAA